MMEIDDLPQLKNLDDLLPEGTMHEMQTPKGCSSPDDWIADLCDSALSTFKSTRSARFTGGELNMHGWTESEWAHC